MKARISAGWPHDSGHFSFYRQSPHDQARIPFVEESRPNEFRDAVIGAIALVAFVGALIALPWVIA